MKTSKSVLRIITTDRAELEALLKEKRAQNAP